MMTTTTTECAELIVAATFLLKARGQIIKSSAQAQRPRECRARTTRAKTERTKIATSAVLSESDRLHQLRSGATPSRQTDTASHFKVKRDASTDSERIGDVPNSPHTSYTPQEQFFAARHVPTLFYDRCDDDQRQIRDSNWKARHERFELHYGMLDDAQSCATWSSYGSGTLAEFCQVSSGLRHSANGTRALSQSTSSRGASWQESTPVTKKTNSGSTSLPPKTHSKRRVTV